jgi:hypothetical protein
MKACDLCKRRIAADDEYYYKSNIMHNDFVVPVFIGLEFYRMNICISCTMEILRAAVDKWESEVKAGVNDGSIDDLRMG